jgi:hypothetical protein
MRALIAQVDPLPAGLGPARTGSEHRHRRIVGVDHAAGHHVPSDQLTDGLEQPGDVAEPFGKLAAVDIDTAAGIDLSPPVERKMMGELGGGDMREEACARHAARDRQLGHEHVQCAKIEGLRSRAQRTGGYRGGDVETCPLPGVSSVDGLS